MSHAPLHYYLLGILSASSSLLESKIIVWDLVGVLFEPNRMKMGTHIVGKASGGNPLTILKITTDIPTEAHMKKVIKDVLDKIESPSPKNHLTKDDNGNSLSDIYCEYLACNIPSSTMLSEIAQSIEDLAKEGYFKNTLERKLVAATMETIFTPRLYAHYMHPIKKGIALLKLCAEKMDKNGKPANQMMILSNWDCESFPILQRKKTSQKVFKYFKDENIFISGQFNSVEGLKPCQWVFNYLMDYKKLKAEDFILIDNAPENVDGARECGMQAIHIKKHDYAAAEAELRKLGAL